MSAEYLDELIDNAQEVIKESRRKHVYPIMIIIEKFLAKYDIPVNKYYLEKDFYSYEVFPVINFIDVINSYNAEVYPELGGEGKCIPQIYKFIHSVFYRGYELVKFFNIFYPHDNHKFIFASYKAQARIGENVKLNYVHPKYVLEEVLHQLYQPEYIDDEIELFMKRNKLLSDWAEIDGSIILPESSYKIEKQVSAKHNFRPKPLITGKYFDGKQQYILGLIKDHIIEAFYDRSVPIVITDSTGLKFIEQTIKNTSANYERVNNNSKSFFDNRMTNVIFKIAGHAVIKVFPLLDYELVPYIEKSDSRRRCHINVAIRLAYNEYITYDIVDVMNVAEAKLEMFAKLIKRQSELDSSGELVSLEECKYLGIYYPMIMYIRELKGQAAAEHKRRMGN